jgi:hypothetical protein
MCSHATSLAKDHDQRPAAAAEAVQKSCWGKSNRGPFSDTEQFIGTCNDLQKHGRHPIVSHCKTVVDAAVDYLAVYHATLLAACGESQNFGFVT